MEKKKNGQLFIIGVLAVTILFMSIGFAAYAQTLNIGGEVTVKPVKWSVHWDTTSFKKDAKSVDITQTEFTDTSYQFTATLTKPGDVAKFTIDAVNDGSFDANLTGITLSSIESYKDYLTYEVKYGDTTYTTTQTGLSTLLAKETGKETVTVTVTYVAPEDSKKLPSNDVVVNLTAAFNYTQVE